MSNRPSAVKVYLRNSLVVKIRMSALLFCLTSGAVCVAEEGVFNQHLLDGPQILLSLKGIGLAQDNEVSVGTFQKATQKFELFEVPGGISLTPGARISAMAPASLVSADGTQSMPVPEANKGLRFAIPHISGAHQYLVMTRARLANVTIEIDGESTDFILHDGVVVPFDAGSANGFAGLVTSDVPVYLVHVTTKDGQRVARPVYPLANELWGLRSQDIYVAAYATPTEINVVGSDGGVETLTLSAGEVAPIAVGLRASAGAGGAVRVSSNQPISAVQTDDGNGVVSLPLVPRWGMRSTFALPVAAEYVSVVCAYTGTEVSLVNASGQTVETIPCNPANDDVPAQVTLRGTAPLSQIAMGSSVRANKPIAAIIEPATNHLEYTTVGDSSDTTPVRPRFNSPVTQTESNPLLSVMFSEPGTELEFYVNGVLEDEEQADWLRGSATGTLPLSDGLNNIRIVAKRGELVSEPLTTAITYNNTIPREQSGRISQDTVWTPGDGTPYVVSGTLTVDSDVTFTILPDVKVLYESGARLSVNGTLDIRGTADRQVVMESVEGEAAEKGDWGGISIRSGAHATIRGLNVRHARTALSFSGTGFVRDSVFTDNTDGIVISNASPLIAANQLERNTNALVVLPSANPEITDGNIVTQNEYGVRVENLARGASDFIDSNDFDDMVPYEIAAYLSYYDLPDVPADTSGNPNPRITGNRIWNNSDKNFIAFGFYDAPNVHVYARNNWWGSTDPALISPKIFDFTDQPHLAPVVDYSYYLSDFDGEPVSGNYLNGPFYESTTLENDTIYTVLGDLVVPEDVSLSAGPGTLVEMPYKFKLLVEGNFSAIGLPTSRARFYSTWDEGPELAKWRGVTVNAKSLSVTLDNFELSDAERGLLFIGRGLTAGEYSIRNGALLRNEKAIAVSGNAKPVIENNDFDGYEIAIDVTALTEATSLSVADDPTPTISTEIINQYQQAGVDINPAPLITGNRFHTDAMNYSAVEFVNSENVRLDAQNNWWGSVDIHYISDRIIDFTDQELTSPVIDYADFLDAPNGEIVPGNYLNGPFLVDANLAAETVYTALGSMVVPVNITIGMQANTWIDFRSAFEFVVEGKLLAQGALARPVRFFSGAPDAAPGFWEGVDIRLSSRESLLDYVVVEDAITGIKINGHTDADLNYEGQPVLESWTQVTRSLFQRNLTGINVIGGAAPRFIDTTSADNAIGALFQGLLQPQLSPQPVINYSDLAANEIALKLQDYGLVAVTVNDGSANVSLDTDGETESTGESSETGDGNALNPTRSEKMVDARFDFWGGEGPVIGENIILESSPEAALDVSEPLDESNNAAAILSMGAQYPYFSPNGDGRQDTVELAAQLSAKSPWTLEVLSASGQVLQSTSGDSDRAAIIWDGSTFSGQPISEGRYGFRVTVTKDETTLNETLLPAVEIDLTHPVAVISSPVEGQYFTLDQYTFNGAATDDHFESFTLTRQALPLPGDGEKILNTDTQSVASGGRLGLWRAKDDAEGEYQFRLTVNDLAGNQTTTVIKGTADRTRPAAEIQLPVQNAKVSNDVTFSGVATDTYLDSYTLEVRRGGVGVFVPITTQSSSVNEGVLGVWHTLGTATDPVVEAGEYQAQVVVTDKAGYTTNSVLRTIQVVHDVLNTPQVSAASVDPYGVTVDVNSSLKTAIPHGMEARLLVYAGEISEGALVRTVSLAGITDTVNFNLPWDGRDNAGTLLPAGNYRFQVQALVNGTLVNTYAISQVVKLQYSVLVSKQLLKTDLKPFASPTPLLSVGLSRAATITTRYYRESDVQNNGGQVEGLAPLATKPVSYSAAGTYETSWDARDDAGQLVVAKLYRAAITISAEGVDIQTDLFAPFTVSYGIASGTTLSANTIDYALADEQVEVSYTVSSGARAELRVITDEQYFANTSVIEQASAARVISNTHSAAGTYSVVWDGLDAEGQRLVGGAYRLAVLIFKDGVLLESYAPTGSGARVAAPGINASDVNFSADRNDPLWFRMNPTNQNMKARMSLTVREGNSTYTVLTPLQAARAGQQTTLIWNGINTVTGRPAYGRVPITILYYTYADNEVFVWGSAPSVRAPDGFITVVSDPYLVYMSYGHITRFQYELDREARVSIKMLPPGVNNPDSPLAITVQTDQLQSAGSQEVEWTGITDADASQKTRVIGDEGVYSFVITARSVDTGDAEQVRGLVSVRH